MNDSYFTIAAPSGATFKEKGSKFLAFTFPIVNEDDFKTQVNLLKKSHSTAHHFCYAYKIGLSEDNYRYNDDGEPPNSAGAPIYGQISSKNITYTAIVVIRYFGGTKLGVGGLINAYRNAAKQALENANIIEKTVQCFYELRFEYKVMPLVMQLIKQTGVTTVQQCFEINCFVEISIRKKNAFKLEARLEKIDQLSYKFIKCN